MVTGLVSALSACTGVNPVELLFFSRVFHVDRNSRNIASFPFAATSSLLLNACRKHRVNLDALADDVLVSSDRQTPKKFTALIFCLHTLQT